jgi:predicted adenine nucleotide alpha hydrolase (AANH) superfamily ATPase
MKILLHTCCAPCASGSIERLIDAGHEVTLLFANSNIDTEEEFSKRLGEVEKLAACDNVNVVHLPYDHEDWLRNVALGFENEPEKGKRCQRCFRYNLLKTQMYAEKNGFDKFSTTLTVSPHKVSETVFAANESPSFLKENFKKHDGFKRSLERSRELNFYRQSYCGCEFSKQKRADNN